MSKLGTLKKASWIPGLLIGGQIAAVAFGFDIWPLSSFPMFSNPPAVEELRQFRLEAQLSDHSTVPLSQNFGKLMIQPLVNALANPANGELDQQLLRFYRVFAKENPGLIDKVESVQLVQRQYPANTPNPTGVESLILHKISKEKLQELASR